MANRRVTEQYHWIEAVEKEKRLRLRWYVNHAAEIQSFAEAKQGLVSEEQRQELANAQKEIVKSNGRVILNVPGDLPFPEGHITDVMRPVDPDIHKMIYKDGRVAYLKKRYLILPEDRYYMPETTSFVHGWKMWNSTMKSDEKRYGRAAIIRQSFYRRRAGIERDPEWYITPTRLSPTICNALR